MAQTPHLPPTQRSGAASNPLPSRKGRGGFMPSPSLNADCGLNPSNRWIFGEEQGTTSVKLAIALWILAVTVRLILIDQPYVDHWSWRQSDVAAIARNFFEHGFRFGYPQIDWAGNSAGYVGTEFPILPFLAAICYKFAGIQEWIGRSQSVIFFAISLPFFFLLVRGIFGSSAATWATFFYAFAPLNVFTGRSFMPDVPSLSLGIVGLYFFQRWLGGGKAAPLYLAPIAISLSILIKATSVVIAAPLASIVVGRLCQTPGVSQNGAGGSRATWTGRSRDR